MGLRLCESEYWADFYTKFFNFQEIRYFDINGEYTGLASKAMSAPDGLIRVIHYVIQQHNAGDIRRP